MLKLQTVNMKKITTIEEDRKQAKMTFNNGEVIIKLPLSLSLMEKANIRKAFLKVYTNHQSTTYPLKVAYKIGEPYIFVNRTAKDNKTETLVSYKIADLW